MLAKKKNWRAKRSKKFGPGWKRKQGLGDEGSLLGWRSNSAAAATPFSNGKNWPGRSGKDCRPLNGFREEGPTLVLIINGCPTACAEQAEIRKHSGAGLEIQGAPFSEIEKCALVWKVFPRNPSRPHRIRQRRKRLGDVGTSLLGQGGERRKTWRDNKLKEIESETSLLEEGLLPAFVEARPGTNAEVLHGLGPGDQKAYTPGNISRLDFLRDIGFPNQYPYTRGVQSSMYRGRLWTMRMFSGFGSAEDTNQRYKYLLSQGQTGLSVAFHYPTLMGYDSDSPRPGGSAAMRSGHRHAEGHGRFSTGSPSTRSPPP